MAGRQPWAKMPVLHGERRDSEALAHSGRSIRGAKLHWAWVDWRLLWAR